MVPIFSLAKWHRSEKRLTDHLDLQITPEDKDELRDLVDMLRRDRLYRDATVPDVVRYGIKLAIAKLRGRIEVEATEPGSV